jgi:hypothetical protein
MKIKYYCPICDKELDPIKEGYKAIHPKCLNKYLEDWKYKKPYKK